LSKQARGEVQRTRGPDSGTGRGARPNGREQRRFSTALRCRCSAPWSRRWIASYR